MSHHAQLVVLWEEMLRAGIPGARVLGTEMLSLDEGGRLALRAKVIVEGREFRVSDDAIEPSEASVVASARRVAGKVKEWHAPAS